MPRKTHKTEGKLTPRQIAFAVNYSVSGNASDAARRAGYTPKMAGAKAHELLKNVGIQALVREEQANRFKRIQMDGDEVLARLAMLARTDIRKVFDEKGALKNPALLDDVTAFQVASVEAQLQFSDDGAPPEEIRKIKLRDPTPALRILAQHHKLVGADVQVNLTEELAERLAAARKRVKPTEVSA